MHGGVRRRIRALLITASLFGFLVQPLRSFGAEGRGPAALVEVLCTKLDEHPGFARNPFSGEAQAALLESIAKAIEDSAKTVSDKDIEAISEMAITLDEFWKAADGHVGKSSYWETVKYMSYCYLTPVALSDAEKERLASQREGIMSYCRELPTEFADAANLAEAERPQAESLFSSARADVEKFIKSPYYRFAQVPLSNDKFDLLLETIDAKVASTTEALRKELAATPQGSLRREPSARSVVLSAAVYLHAGIAREMARAHMNSIYAKMSRRLYGE